MTATMTEEFVFIPTGTLDDVPVMKVPRGVSFVYLNEKGEKVAKGEKVYHEADAPEERSAEDEEEARLRQLEEEFPEPVFSEEPYPLELNADELQVCITALVTQNRGEHPIQPLIATWQHGRTVLFSRRENGLDRRRLITLPDAIQVTAQDVG